MFLLANDPTLSIPQKVRGVYGSAEDDTTGVAIAALEVGYFESRLQTNVNKKCAEPLTSEACHILNCMMAIVVSASR